MTLHTTAKFKAYSMHLLRHKGMPLCAILRKTKINMAGELSLAYSCIMTEWPRLQTWCTNLVNWRSTSSTRITMRSALLSDSSKRRRTKLRLRRKRSRLTTQRRLRSVTLDGRTSLSRFGSLTSNCRGRVKRQRISSAPNISRPWWNWVRDRLVSYI